MKQANEPEKQNDGKNYGTWFGFGIEFCGVVGLFCYIGYKLDESIKTSPWFMLTGFFIGFTGMLYIIIKDTWNQQGKDKK